MMAVTLWSDRPGIGPEQLAKGAHTLETDLKRVAGTRDVYTIGANLAGLAGISVPCGSSSTGLPIGLQLLAAPLAEEKLLRIARAYERVTDWHLRRPD